MKLLYCDECNSVFNLKIDKVTSCDCGKTAGMYLDSLYAVYKGGDTTFPLGFANSSVQLALTNQPKVGPGKKFTAFVIEQECPTMWKVDKLPETDGEKLKLLKRMKATHSIINQF